MGLVSPFIASPERKLQALKQEIGNAEKVQKILKEERTGVDIPKPTKERVTETSL